MLKGKQGTVSITILGHRRCILGERHGRGGAMTGDKKPEAAGFLHGPYRAVVEPKPGLPLREEPGFQLKPDGFQTLHQAICKKPQVLQIEKKAVSGWRRKQPFFGKRLWGLPIGFILSQEVQLFCRILSDCKNCDFIVF